eukprot:scaffold127815_cov36-Phaeocystis_antarctica.AAC.1
MPVQPPCHTRPQCTAQTPRRAHLQRSTLGPACSTSEATSAGAPSRTRSAATPSRSSPPSSSVTPMCSSSQTRSSCLHRTAAVWRRWLSSVTRAPIGPPRPHH